VTEQQVVRLEIDGIAHRGEGVGRHEGLVVFVPYAVPGELVAARITERRRSYARGELVELLRPSPDRVDPPCPVYCACGGCQLQHIAYPAQLSHKRQRVADALERIGGLGPDQVSGSAAGASSVAALVAETLPSPDSLHYRNKAQFPVAPASGESAPLGAGTPARLCTGCFAAGTHRVVPVDECIAQHPTNNAIMRVGREAAGRAGLEAYDEAARTGDLRHILGRVAPATGEALAVLVTAREDVAGLGDVARALMREVPGLTGVVQNINDRRTNVILGPRYRRLAGRATIVDRIDGLEFEISASSFYQVNSAQAARLYDLALEGVELGPERTAIDVYAGVGSLALWAAVRGGAGRVLAIEESRAAVRDGQANARRNGARAVHFACERAERVLPWLARRPAGKGSVPRSAAPGVQPRGAGRRGRTGAAHHRLRLLQSRHPGPRPAPGHPPGLPPCPRHPGGHVSPDGACGVCRGGGEGVV